MALDHRPTNPQTHKSENFFSERGNEYGSYILFSGICYGFEVMECAESPNRPFSLLKSRFEGWYL